MCDLSEEICLKTGWSGERSSFCHWHFECWQFRMPPGAGLGPLLSLQ